MSRAKNLGSIPKPEDGTVNPGERIYETPWWVVEQIDRLHELPAGTERVISRHSTVKAAGVRIAQMRRTARWGELPITLRAGEAPIIPGDDREGAIFMSLSDTPLAEKARRLVQIDWSAGTQKQRAALLVRLLDDYEQGRKTTLPKSLYVVTLPGPIRQQREAMEEAGYADDDGVEEQ